MKTNIIIIYIFLTCSYCHADNNKIDQILDVVRGNQGDLSDLSLRAHDGSVKLQNVREEIIAIKAKLTPIVTEVDKTKGRVELLETKLEVQELKITHGFELAEQARLTNKQKIQEHISTDSMVKSGLGGYVREVLAGGTIALLIFLFNYFRKNSNQEQRRKNE